MFKLSSRKDDASKFPENSELERLSSYTVDLLTETRTY